MIPDCDLKTAYRDRRVLVTGHTGFKGAWLCEMLLALGARPYGLALPPATQPSLSQVLDLERRMPVTIGDIRDYAAVDAAVREAAPDMVFHLAAQALVGESYDDPVGTYGSNVMGTVHVLEAVRRHNVSALLVVTSDKVYRNDEAGRPFTEADELGGHDPYSSSKACAELVTSAYRSSYFGPSGTLVATARAGNVIGGGDWAAGRIIPDFVRATFVDGAPVVLRNPQADRPWQMVLEPLYGYLLLGMRLLAGDARVAQAWNFGPPVGQTVRVGEIIEKCIRHLGRGSVRTGRTTQHEAGRLRLDSSAAHAQLGWRSLLELDEALALTLDWYQEYYLGGGAVELARSQIDGYFRRALALPQ